VFPVDRGLTPASLTRDECAGRTPGYGPSEVTTTGPSATARMDWFVIR